MIYRLYLLCILRGYAPKTNYLCVQSHLANKELYSKVGLKVIIWFLGQHFNPSGSLKNK